MPKMASILVSRHFSSGPPAGRGALAFVDDGVAGPPAAIIATTLEADVAGGPHPQQGEAPWLSRPTALQALPQLLSTPPPPFRPTLLAALTPFRRGALALADDSVAGSPAVIVAIAIEANFAGGPHPLRERRPGARGRQCRRPSCGRRHPRP